MFRHPTLHIDGALFNTAGIKACLSILVTWESNVDLSVFT